MFLLKGVWDALTHGFHGVMEVPEDTGSPGRTPTKSTIVLGGGWQYDDAEAARVTAAAMLPEDRVFRQRVTMQGEARVLAAKTPAGPFDMRTPRRRGPTKPKQQPQRVKLSRAAAAEAGTPRRRPMSPYDRGASPSSIVCGDSLWDSNSLGFTGNGKFATLTVANAANSPMRSEPKKIFTTNVIDRSLLYD